MTRYLAFTRIGCTKILKHIWMAELKMMISGNRYGKKKLFYHPKL